MVDEVVGGEHLKHMRKLNEHLADRTCFWHVLGGYLGKTTHRESTFNDKKYPQEFRNFKMYFLLLLN